MEEAPMTKNTYQLRPTVRFHRLVGDVNTFHSHR